MKTIVCNMCGKQFDEFDKNMGVSISTRLGYGSSFDGSLIDMDLCCDCVDKLIDNCEISPIIEE